MVNPGAKRLLLLFLALSSVVLLGLIAAFRSSAFDSYVKQKLIAAVAPEVRVTIGDFSLSGTSVEMRQVEAYLPRSFLGLSIDQLHLGLSLWRLIQGRVDLQLSLAAYSGKATLALIADRSGSVSLPEIDVQKVNLAEHPQLAGSGIESGVLSLKGTGLLFANVPQAGDLELDLRQVTIARDSIVFQQLQIPGELLPPIENGSISGPIRIERDRIHSPDIRLSLGFASFRGLCTVNLDPRGKLREFNVNGVVDLEPSGAERVGPFLPALSAGKLEATATRFKVLGSGSPKNPRWRFESVK